MKKEDRLTASAPPRRLRTCRSCHGTRNRTCRRASTRRARRATRAPRSRGCVERERRREDDLQVLAHQAREQLDVDVQRHLRLVVGRVRRDARYAVVFGLVVVRHGERVLEELRVAGCHFRVWGSEMGFLGFRKEREDGMKKIGWGIVVRRRRLNLFESR